MTIFPGDSLSFRRLTAVASPMPMAVPCSKRPTCNSRIKPCTMFLSVVNGHCVKASPSWLRDFERKVRRRHQRASPLVMLRRQLFLVRRARSAMSQSLRKADTRRKIELGGLVIKAGADQIDAMVLLGMLAEAMARLAVPGEVDRLQSLGRSLARKKEQ